MTNKLTVTQQKVLDDAKKEIDRARKYNTYEEYFIAEDAKTKNLNYNTPEKYKALDIKGWNIFKEYWERKIDGITLTHCNSTTIRKLEKLGLIEIINDGGQYIDTIKVLNY